MRIPRRSTRSRPPRGRWLPAPGPGWPGRSAIPGGCARPRRRRECPRPPAAATPAGCRRGSRPARWPVPPPPGSAGAGRTGLRPAVRQLSAAARRRAPAARLRPSDLPTQTRHLRKDPMAARPARMADTGVMTRTHTAAAPAVTLAGQRIELLDRARVYACGITPYDVTHLGHAATFVWIDTLGRVLRLLGVQP